MQLERTASQGVEPVEAGDPSSQLQTRLMQHDVYRRDVALVVQSGSLCRPPGRNKGFRGCFKGHLDFVDEALDVLEMSRAAACRLALNWLPDVCPVHRNRDCTGLD